MGMTWILVLGMVHAVFLMVIALRLSALGYPGSSTVTLVCVSFVVWAVAFFVGAVARIDLFTAGMGLPSAILSAGLWFAWLEVWVLMENDQEKRTRIASASREEKEHVRRAEVDAEVISRLMPVKNYVGDDATIIAISDLGKLKDHGIPCRIQGSLIKTLYLPERDVARAAQVIALEVSEEEPEVGAPTSGI